MGVLKMTELEEKYAQVLADYELQSINIQHLCKLIKQRNKEIRQLKQEIAKLKRKRNVK